MSVVLSRSLLKCRFALPVFRWSTVPALLIAGAFAVGIGLNEIVTGGPVWGWIPGVVLGAGLFVILEWWGRSQMVTLAPLGRLLAVLLVVLCAGGLRHAVYTTPSPQTVASVADAEPDRPLSLVGVVEGAPDQSGSAVRLTLSVDSLTDAHETRSADGRVRVTLRPSPWASRSVTFPGLSQGDRVRLRGTLRRPPGQRNPGGFDYAAYLSRRGICCTMYVDDPGAVTIRARSSSVLSNFVVAARHHIRDVLSRYVPSADGQAVLRALLLGERGALSEKQEQRFAQTGLMHLLAVSGLHVFLVGMVLYVLLRPVLMRLRLDWGTIEASRAILTLLVLGFYMLLTGGRTSVVRAVVMSALFIGSIVLQRSTHPLNTLGAAALVLLAVRPTALFDVGFQLSMAAVAGIVTIHPQIVDNLPDLWTETPIRSGFVSLVSPSLAATAATAPVLLVHFGWVSVAGLLLNVVGIPCTALALSSAVVLVLVGDLWTVAGAAFGSSADVFVHGLLLASREGAEWLGWAGVRVFNPDVWTVGGLVAGVFAISRWSNPRSRWRGLLCALFFATAGVWVDAVDRSAPPTLDVLFFDVGQGDAVFVETPDDRRLLVDTGPRSSAGSSAAAEVLLPYFRQRGIEHLDAIVITHPDADHLGGLPPLLREMSVGRVLHSGQHAQTDLYRRSRRLLQEEAVPHTNVQRGDTLSLETHLRGRVLGPPENPARRGIESENEASVVLKLTYGTTEILLPGDIEQRAERDLVDVYGSQLQSQIVKIPHHGSSTSSTLPFVRAVVRSEERPHAVVSVDVSNRFGMPSSRVLNRWRSSGAKVSSTAQQGAVWLRSDGSDVWRVSWR